MKKTIQQIAIAPDIGGLSVTVFFTDNTKLSVTIDQARFKPNTPLFGADVVSAIGEMLGCQTLAEGTFFSAFAEAFDTYFNNLMKQA